MYGIPTCLLSSRHHIKNNLSPRHCTVIIYHPTTVGLNDPVLFIDTAEKKMHLLNRI